MADRNSVLIAVVLSLLSTIASSGGPFILAHKKATLTPLKSGAKRLSVSIDIYNQGSAGTVLSHSFELEAKTKTVFYGAPAAITFHIPTKAALQEAYSTPILPLDILADRPPEKKFDWAKSLLAKYGSLISVVSIVVMFVYLVASPSKSNVAKGNKKKHYVGSTTWCLFKQGCISSWTPSVLVLSHRRYHRLPV